MQHGDNRTQSVLGQMCASCVPSPCFERKSCRCETGMHGWDVDLANLAKMTETDKACRGISPRGELAWRDVTLEAVSSLSKHIVPFV